MVGYSLFYLFYVIIILKNKGNINYWNLCNSNRRTPFLGCLFKIFMCCDGEKLQKSLVEVSDISVCISESELVPSEKQKKKSKGGNFYFSIFRNFLLTFINLWGIFYFTKPVDWLTEEKKYRLRHSFMSQGPQLKYFRFVSKWLVHDQIIRSDLQ